MSEEKVLTREIAEQFLRGEGTINQYQTIDSPETAKLLATAECDLELVGLTRIDLDIAAELIQHTGGDLWLDGLLELPLDLAQVLSKHVGRITFDSVADLDVETATAIAQKKGALGFNGICNLPHLIARALCEGQIEELELAGLTSLSDAAAASLGKYEGNLSLNSLTKLSDAAVESLSKHEGGLALCSLTELSDAAVESLSKLKGALFLNGLTELSDAAAKSLSKHQGNYLSLNGLTELSDAAAASLSKNEAELLFLDGLTELSDAAAESLSFHKGTVVLDGLTETAVQLYNQYCSTLTLTRARQFAMEEHAVILSDFTYIDDEAAIFLSGQPSRKLDLTGLKSISLKSVSNLVINHELMINKEHLSDEMIKAIDEGNRLRLEKKKRRDATSGWCMFGEISGPSFQLICGGCGEETIEELMDIAGGTAYEDTYDRAEELGWTINCSESWTFENVIRCPQCSVKDPCPSCGDTVLITIRGEETAICMECETERLQKLF